MKGLVCDILVSSRIGECSNGGISSRCKAVVLVDPTTEKPLGPFEPDEEMPAVIIKQGWKGSFHAVLLDQSDCEGVGPMWGGGFIYTCDSRFPHRHPIKLHDRYESQEQYDMLSR